MKIGIVILAAGESARMGEPKQLLAYAGTTLLEHAVASAEAIPGATVVVVLGANAAEIRAQLRHSNATIAENPDWKDGMGGSIRVGLKSLLEAHPDTAAVLLLLCDQPLVSPQSLQALVSAYESQGQPIVASSYAGTLGVPALFGREFFPELLALTDAGGAKQVIRNHEDRAVGISFAEGSVDIDTPADYQRLCGLVSESPALSAP